MTIASQKKLIDKFYNCPYPELDTYSKFLIDYNNNIDSFSASKYNPKDYIDINTLKHLEEKQKLKTPFKNINLHLAKLLCTTNKAYVFKAKDINTGNYYSLKILRKVDEEMQKKLFIDFLNLDFLNQHSIAATPKIIEFGPNYLLKEWVEGSTGDQWISLWQEQGMKFDDQAFKQLILENSVERFLNS